MKGILNQLSKGLTHCLFFSVGCATVQVLYTVGQFIGVSLMAKKVVPSLPLVHFDSGAVVLAGGAEVHRGLQATGQSLV
jgi:hypothetical protein